jgi:hypothetical protein
MVLGKRSRKKFRVVEGPFPDPTNPISDIQIVVVQAVTEPFNRITAHVSRFQKLKVGETAIVWTSKHGSVVAKAPRRSRK